MGAFQPLFIYNRLSSDLSVSVEYPVKKDMQSESMGPSGVEVGSWIHGFSLQERSLCVQSAGFSLQEMGGPSVCRVLGPCLVSDPRG